MIDLNDLRNSREFGQRVIGMHKKSTSNSELATVSRRESRLELITTEMRSQSANPLALTFDGNGDEFAFDEQDAEFALKVIGLPEQGRLPFAFVNGVLRGADLALALFCPLIVLSPSAQLGSGFGQPGSSAVYVAAARRIGPVACEKLLFRRDMASAAETLEYSLSVVAGNLSDAFQIAAVQSRTLISVARANLVTWPITLKGLVALVDNEDASRNDSFMAAS